MSGLPSSTIYAGPRRFGRKFHCCSVDRVCRKPQIEKRETCRITATLIDVPNPISPRAGGPNCDSLSPRSDVAPGSLLHPPNRQRFGPSSGCGRGRGPITPNLPSPFATVSSIAALPRSGNEVDVKSCARWSSRHCLQSAVFEFSRPINLFAHGVAASAVLMRCQFLKGNRGNFNMQIDSVE